MKITMHTREFVDQAIILRLGRFKESDCWVRCMTPSQGIITGFAFGGLKSRRRFPACLDNLNHVQFRFSYNKHEYITLQEGSILNRFAGLSSKPVHLGMLVNCVKFLEAVQLGSPEAEQAFALLLNILDILDFRPDCSKNLPLYFRARLSVIYGYAPELCHCHFCGQELGQAEKVALDIKKGQSSCPKCSQDLSETRVIFRPSEFKHFKEVMYGSPEHWPLDRSKDPEMFRPVQAMDRFVHYHMGLVWQGKGFRQAA